MRMWAKKLVRLAAASRAACQGGSSSSNTVCRQRHRQELLAVPEIMFELVAVVFEDVEAFVLDFPSRPAAGDDLGDIVLGDGKAGYPGHGICDLSLGVDNLEADPVDQDCILPVMDRNVLDPAVTECLSGVAPADLLLVAERLGAVDEVVERFVRGRLAGEDEIVAGVRHHLADGMTGEQIVAEIDRAQRRDPSVVTVEPAFDGVVAMNRRFTLSSQSCFSAPSWLTTNSGIRGTTLEWPGATTVADSRQ